MVELLNVFNSYNDIEHKAYFAFVYNAIPSELIFETPMKVEKKNMDLVLGIIKPEEQNFELIFKNWNVDVRKNVEQEKDFPSQQLYKKKDGSCLLWIALHNESVLVDFLYDCKQVTLEQWVLETKRELQMQLGKEKSPVFKVLAKYGYGFDTEDVNTEKTVVDIATNYNDDFAAIHKNISESIDNKGSGLILLHGTPGTGKTTYIKNLISTYDELDFIFIQNEFVNNLLDPDFISFMLQKKNSVLIIEDAEKVITSRELNNEASIVSTILQLTDGLFSDYLNIKIICTFNSNLSKIDPALLRKGRMISMYEFKPLSLEKTNLLLSEMGKEQSTVGMTLADIYNREQNSFENIPKGKVGF